MGNPFGEDPTIHSDEDRNEQQQAAQAVDIVTLLSENSLVPDIEQWLKVVKGDPSSKEYPEIRVWIFQMGVDPTNLHSSEIFDEIARIVTHVPAGQESRDEPEKDPTITLMRLFEGKSFQVETVSEGGETSIEEDIPLPPGYTSEFLKSERYRQIVQSRSRVKRPEGVTTTEEYLSFLKTIPLRAELTVIDGYEMLVHLQVFAQKSHSEKMRKIPDEDLLVMRMYFGPDVDVFRGLVSWMQKNGVEIDLPMEEQGPR